MLSILILGQPKLVWIASYQFAIHITKLITVDQESVQ